MVIPDKLPENASEPAELSIPMRDGVTLTATLFAPPGLRQFPVILSRTPYGRGEEYGHYVSEGYGVISEDVRGRGHSGGKWEPFLNERKDGSDTVEWIAKQPWSNGNVGMIGASYLGYVQWAAAAEHPPHLKCIVPVVSPPDPNQNLPYENGCFLLAVSLWYTSLIGKSTPVPEATRLAPPAAYESWPISGADVALNGTKNDVFQRWIQMDSPEDWRTGETIEDAAKINIPSLSISGWFDGDQVGTQLHWAASHAADRWLVYGPWGHTLSVSNRVGDLEIRPGTIPNVPGLESEFFRRFLKQDVSALSKEPHVQAFALGANKWFKTETWPAPTATLHTLYFGADLSLRNTPSATISSRSYTMDPNHVRSSRRLRQFPLDDTEPYLLTEEDLPYGHLMFQGEVLAKPEIFGGPFTANLAFSIDTPDADFFIQPMDAYPNGTFLPIGQGGKFRARRFLNLPHLMGGKVYSAHLKLWDSLFQIPTGHHLAVMISSDHCPVYALNSNTAEPMASATRRIVTHPQIFSGSDGKQGLPASSFSFSIIPQ